MASLYLDESLAPEAFQVGARLALGGPDARHAVQVARVRVGERVAIGDGRGRIARGPVAVAGAGEVVIEVEEVEHAAAPAPAIWLAQALAKGGRDELALQAATELGIAGAIPWAASRSVSRWEGAKAAKGRERWASIAREAAKQSIRATVPEVAGLATTADLAGLPGILLVLDPEGAEAVSAVALDGAERVTLVVGPEGGIDPRELAELTAAGAHRVRLGPEVLRASTAGPAAIAALSVRLGRW